MKRFLKRKINFTGRVKFVCKPKVSNGRSARIRAWLANNPDKRSLEVAIGINDPDKGEVARELARMKQLGVVACRDEGFGKKHYTLIPDAPIRKPKSYSIKTPLDFHKKTQLAVPAFTSDDFIRAGGIVQRLPSHWDAFPHARPGFEVQHEGLTRAHKA